MAPKRSRIPSYQMFLGRDVKSLEGPNFPLKGDMLSFYYNTLSAKPERSEKDVAHDVVYSCMAVWESMGIPTGGIGSGLKNLRKLIASFKDMKKSYAASPTRRQYIIDSFRQKCSLVFLVGSETPGHASVDACTPVKRAQIRAARSDRIAFDAKSIDKKAKSLGYRFDGEANASDLQLNVTDDMEPPRKRHKCNSTPAADDGHEEQKGAIGEAAASQIVTEDAPPNALSQEEIDRGYKELLKADHADVLAVLGLLDEPMVAAGSGAPGLGVGVAAKYAGKASESAANRKRATKAGLDAESSARSTKRTETKSALAGINADEMPASQGAPVETRRPTKTKPRLETQSKHDEDTSSSKDSTNLDVVDNSSASTELLAMPKEPRQLETHENPAHSLDTAEKAAAINARNSTGQHGEEQASPIDGSSSARRSRVETSSAKETAKEANAESSEPSVEEQLEESQVATIIVETSRHTAHREEKESLKEASSASRTSSVTGNATETTKEAEEDTSPVKTAEDEYCLAVNEDARSSNDVPATQTIRNFDVSPPSSNSTEAALLWHWAPGGCPADEEDVHVNTEILEKVAEDEKKNQRDSLDGTKPLPDPDTSSPSSTALEEKKGPSLGDTLLIDCTCSLQQLSHRSTETPSATETSEEEDEASLGEISTDDDDEGDQVIENARGVLKCVGEEVKALSEHTLALVQQIEPSLVPQLREALNSVAASSALSTKRARRRRRGADEEDDPRPAAKHPRLDVRARHDEEGSPLDSTYTGVSSSNNSSYDNTSSELASDSLEVVTTSARVDAEISADDEEQQAQMIDEVSIVNSTTTPQPRHPTESPTHPRQDHPQCGAGPSEDLIQAVDVNGRVLLMTDNRPRGYTPLHFAVEYDLMQTAKTILERNPDALYAADKRGTTPLHLAGKLERMDMLDLLLDYDELHYDLADDDGMTHFMCACLSSRVSEVEKFLTAAESTAKPSPGTSVEKMKNSRVKDGPFAGHTPMMIAERFGRRDTVNVLKNC